MTPAAADQSDDLADLASDLVSRWAQPPERKPREAPTQHERDGGERGRRRPGPLPFLTFAEADADDSDDELIEGLLSTGTMSVIYGESGCGKTFFATDLALTVASGHPWRDREVRRGGALYLALEGARGIRNRVAAAKADKGWGGYDLPLAIVTTSVDLLNPKADTDQVIATAHAVAAKFDQPLVLIIVDTVSRAIAGGNENASDAMGALVRNGDRLRQETGAHVAWIHHTGKDQARGARGHSLLRAATDTEIEITVDGPARIARVTKQRDMECAGEFAFTLKPVEIGTDRHGKPLTSCVVEHETERPHSAPTQRLSGHNKRAYEILADMLAGSGDTGHSGVPPDCVSVPEQWWRERFYNRALPGASPDTKKRAFRRAADHLVKYRKVGMASGRVWLPTPPGTDDDA